MRNCKDSGGHRWNGVSGKSFKRNGFCGNWWTRMEANVLQIEGLSHRHRPSVVVSLPAANFVSRALRGVIRPATFPPSPKPALSKPILPVLTGRVSARMGCR